ncbi:MAG: hypothetical protein H0X65_13885 [Gemmatimonadetes bacterium]|nr:hypothetical protein [Gemmatimonadota bacterium]
MKHLLRNLTIGFAAAAVSLTIGCTDAPTAVIPDAEPVAAAFSTEASSPDLSVLSKTTQRMSITIAWAKKWIGPEGGRLDFRGYAIEVPAGAVDGVTQFSIRLPVDPHGSARVVAEFGPHGATFAVPVAIEFPFAGTSIEGSEKPTVVWWNDAWIDMGGSPTPDGARLRTTTDHFSTYGTTDERSVTSTSGG